MTAVLRKAPPLVLQGAICIVVGMGIGRILLLDLSLKWRMVFLAGMAVGVLVLMVGQPRRTLLFLLGLTAPVYLGKAFVLATGLFSLNSGAGINLADLLALMLLFLLLIRLATRQVKFRLYPWITVPALAWLVLSAISLAGASDTQLVAIQLVCMGKLLLLAWVVAASVEDETDVTVVIVGMMLGMLFQAGVGVFQGVTGRPLGLSFLTETAEVHKQPLSTGFVNRVQGTMGHPNSYAMYLSTVIPFALAILIASRRLSVRILTGIACGMGCLALIYSLSRSAWIDLMLAIGIVLVLGVYRKRISAKGAILVACVIAMALCGLVFYGPTTILDRITSDDRGAAYSRVAQAQAALAMMQDHPWVGVGLNNYSVALGKYDAAANVRGVHNVFLMVAAETGLFGLMAFLSLLAVLLIRSFRAVSRAPSDTLWVAGVGVFCAFVALASHGMADYALLGSVLVFTQFWLLAGLAAALPN